MGLRLTYPDRYRLWSELVHASAQRVFVQSDTPMRISMEVPVEISLPDLPLSIVLRGTVVGLRPKSDKFPAGVFVSFSEKEVGKCRAYLGLAPSPERFETGRRSIRVDCQLPIRWVVPAVNDTCIASNISEAGLLAKCPVALHIGQQVTINITLDTGVPLLCRAEVTWTRNELGLVGVQFIDQTAEHQRLVSQCIQRLAALPINDVKEAQVVIADDDVAVIDMLHRALTSQGFSVQRVNRGNEALQVIRRSKPKLVILDILMPGMDGKDVCKQMRADAEMATIPVILLSALDRGNLHSVAEEVGASDYLNKPIKMNELGAMTTKYLPAKTPASSG